ncbi:MAG: flavodoxin [Candidatus Margulisbacteria bacterium]|nr:flavodoxin [Candidatus Margulisiibacteriota bacterium]
MKTLVVYYSKTGTTKKLAERLAKELKADIEGLIDKKKRSGIMGWLIAGRDGMKRIATDIEPIKNKPANYDLVLIGGPLWGFTGVAPATRTYLLQNKDKIKKAAFFMTRGGGSPSDPALNDLKNVYGKAVAGTLDIKQSKIDSPETAEQIKAFVGVLTK